MTTELASEMMTTEEAHAAAEEIRKLTQSFARDLGKLRALALDFHGRKGWAALGYNTIEACAKNEFGWKRSQFYAQLTAGKIEASAGIPVGSFPQRAIARIATSSQQRVRQPDESLQGSCEEAAATSTNGPVIAEKVRQAVEKIEQPETFPLEPLPDDPAEVERLKAETRRVVEEAWDAYEPKPDEDLHLDYSSMQAPQQSVPEPKKITPSGITGADMARVEFAPPIASDLGEIEVAVLKRHKISIGQAAGYFAQIVAAAEQGGPSWEMRLRIAARPNPK